MMLRLVGYWIEDDGPDWPHPRDLVDPAWEIGDRARIVSYLRDGVRIHEDLGYSHCRFSGGPPDAAMGNAELSDGVWIWPEGLWIYVDQYSVKLPADFVEHMRSNNFAVPTGLDAGELESARMDFDYWRKWSRRNTHT
jgi:hypothetical protein